MIMLDMMKLTILTADRRFYQGEIKSIKVTNKEGILEVLPNHISLITTIIPSVTKFEDLEGKEHKLFTSAGILRVKKGQVDLLCEDSKCVDNN
ncbi:F-ATPase epsilon subunit [Clostridium sp. N3C]|nr:F-ATPase epsilon subunit [Clostridium sp. N3C]